MPQRFRNVNSSGEESTPLLRTERRSNTHRYATEPPPTSASANRTSNWVMGHFSDHASPFDHATAPPPSTNASVRSSSHLPRFGYPQYPHPYRNATAPPLSIVERQRDDGHRPSGNAHNLNATEQRSLPLPAFDSAPDRPEVAERAEVVDVAGGRLRGTFGSSIEVAIFNLCVIGVVVALTFLVLGLCYGTVLIGIEIEDTFGATGLTAYIAFIGVVLACWACACLVATTDD